MECSANSGYLDMAPDSVSRDQINCLSLRCFESEGLVYCFALNSECTIVMFPLNDECYKHGIYVKTCE